MKFIEKKASKEIRKNRKLVFGVGINDSPYEVHTVINGKTVVCPFYNEWYAMMKDCYSEESKRKYPKGSRPSVTKEWHKFTAFRKWMKTQPWEGKVLAVIK